MVLFDYRHRQSLTLDQNTDECEKIDLMGELFRSGPCLSPRKPKKDTTEDKLKVLQDEVTFLRQHSKTLQTENTEHMTMIGSL
jgi:hypothetical protein